MRRLVTFVGSLVVAGLSLTLTVMSRIPRTPLWLVTALGGLAAALAASSSDRIKGELSRILTPDSAAQKIIREQFAAGPDGWRHFRVGQADALDLGVHAAEPLDPVASSSANCLPPYAKRDLHDWLVKRINEGGFILLQGRSAAGKTRLAFEAMLEAVSDYRLLVPDDGKALSALASAGGAPEKTLIWLDDLERYLGLDGLSRPVIDRLCPQGSSTVVILATLRLEARSALAPAAESSRDMTRLVDDVLARATKCTLTHDGLSATERHTAAMLDDPRITHALAHSDNGFGAILCGGPAAVDRWTRGAGGENLTGAALITALVDCRRTGYPHAVPSALLVSLYRYYLNPQDQDRADLPSVDDGLAWATRRHNGASCMIPHADGSPKEGSFYRPFDYLLDHIPTHLNTGSVPGQIWDATIALADPLSLVTMGITAYVSSGLAHAERCFRAAAGENSAALFHLGVLLVETGRPDEAEDCFKEAIGAGHTRALFNLGNLLARSGRIHEAETCYRRAVDGGFTGALNNLGVLLANAGSVEEAEIMYRRAALAEQPLAWFNLGILLAESGRVAEAEDCYAEAIGAEITDAMNNLGLLLAETGRANEAEECFRLAAKNGNEVAVSNLGNLLAEEGRLAEAEDCYREAIEAGITNALGNYQRFLRNTGRTTGSAGVPAEDTQHRG